MCKERVGTARKQSPKHMCLRLSHEGMHSPCSCHRMGTRLHLKLVAEPDNIVHMVLIWQASKIQVSRSHGCLPQGLQTHLSYTMSVRNDLKEDPERLLYKV